MNIALTITASLYGIFILFIALRRGLSTRTGWLMVTYLLFSGAVPGALAAAEPLAFSASLVQRVLAFLLAMQLATVGLLTFFALNWRARVWWLLASVLWVATVAGLDIFLPDAALTFGDFRLSAGMSAGIIGWVLLGTALVLAAIYAYLTARLPMHANRVLFWSLMLLLCLIGQFVPLSPDPGSLQIGLGLHLIGAIGLTYSVLNYRMFDVREMMRRGLGYALSTIIVACVVLVGLLIATQVANGPTGLVSVVVIAVLLAVVFQPLWQFSQTLIQRYVLSLHTDPARLVRDYSQAIGEILDVDQLATAAVGMISDVLEVRRGALLLVTELDEGQHLRLRPVRGMGQLPTDERAFPRTSLVIRHFTEKRLPLLQYDIDLGPGFRDLDAEERAWWHNLMMDVYVPIMGRDLPIGILALGPKGSGDSFRPYEIELLTTLSGQTAVALKNARLFSEMRQLNAEVNLLNDDLTRTNDRLQHLDKVKSDFITIASHELRTPLTQVRGYTDILSAMNEEGQLTQQQVTEISVSLSRASERLEQVISAMLDTSQIDVQAMSLHFVETNMDTVLRFCIEKLAGAMRERKQTLTVRGVNGLPIIHGDFQRLTQAINNLLTNAIKFTPDGGKITITGQRLTAQAGPGDFIEVIIADTGVGLDPKDHELIFEKFYRVGNPHFHSTGSTKFMGAGPGLGLPIARGVIEAHGGRLWVESPGFDPKAFPGSAFHMVLPLVPPAMLAEALEGNSEPAKSERPGGPQAALAAAGLDKAKKRG